MFIYFLLVYCVSELIYREMNRAVEIRAAVEENADRRLLPREEESGERQIVLSSKILFCEICSCWARLGAWSA